MVTALPDTGLSKCLVGRSLTIQMGISRHKLAVTSKKLVKVNGKQIQLDDAKFLNLNMRKAASN